VLSTIFTLALLAGGVYVWYRSSGGGGGGDDGGSGGSGDVVQVRGALAP
jgi:hypothetical protein